MGSFWRHLLARLRFHRPGGRVIPARRRSPETTVAIPAHGPSVCSHAYVVLTPVSPVVPGSPRDVRWQSAFGVGRGQLHGSGPALADETHLSARSPLTWIGNSPLTSGLVFHPQTPCSVLERSPLFHPQRGGDAGSRTPATTTSPSRLARERWRRDEDTSAARGFASPPSRSRWG
jgi:hypothetical protein